MLAEQLPALITTTLEFKDTQLPDSQVAEYEPGWLTVSTLPVEPVFQRTIPEHPWAVSWMVWPGKILPFAGEILGALGRGITDITADADTVAQPDFWH
jgi:hypothetical protein